MLGMQELVDVAGVEVIGTNRLRLPFADAPVGQVDFGEWPLPVLISRSFAAGDTFVTSTPYRRLDRHFASPGGSAFSLPRLPIGRPCNVVSLRLLPLPAGQAGDS